MYQVELELKKTLLACMEEMEPMLGMNHDAFWFSNQMAPILIGPTRFPPRVWSIPQIYWIELGY